MDEALLAKISGKMSPRAREGFLAFLNSKDMTEEGIDSEEEFEIVDIDNVAAMLPADILQIHRNKFKELQNEMREQNILPVDENELIIDGVDINEKGEYGHTALIRAVLENDIRLVKELLDKGADKDIRDNSDQDAFDKAQRREYYEIMGLLNPGYVMTD